MVDKLNFLKAVEQRLEAAADGVVTHADGHYWSYAMRRYIGLSTCYVSQIRDGFRTPPSHPPGESKGAQMINLVNHHCTRDAIQI